MSKKSKRKSSTFVENLCKKDGLIKEGESLYDSKHLQLMHHINAALRAQNLYQKDVDYILENGEVVDQLVSLVNPEKGIDPYVTKLTGITNKMVRTAPKFYELAKRVVKITEDCTFVAHNISFDSMIMQAELIRSNNSFQLATMKQVCTMKSTTDFCRIPGPYGNKWPKLVELHQVLFGTGIPEAHDALVDVEAMAKCYWELIRRNVLR